MTQNTQLGVLLCVLGGLAGATFYLPFKGVRRWAWESYWFVYGVVALILVPWALAFTVSPNLIPVLKATPPWLLAVCYLFGAMWGVGGLTWGLMIRYLGVGLGLAIGCGLCASVGTLVPPLFSGKAAELVSTAPGIASLVGILVAVAGIAVTGAAGMSKERELPEEVKRQSVAEFNFPKGLLIAILSGVMSAGMFFGISAGAQIEALSQQIEPVTPALWQGVPVLVVVLAGGATVNLIWCLLLNAKNHTGGDYCKADTPLVVNYLCSAAAGVLWYLQFVTLTIGKNYMGKYAFNSWALLMSSMIIFSTICGIALAEWRGCSGRTKTLLAAGLAILVAAVLIIGYGNYLGELAKTAK
jgi:L-rhamnose-H+ transport protein